MTTRPRTALALLLFACLAGCGTAQGFGEDVQAVEDTAEAAREELSD